MMGSARCEGEGGVDADACRGGVEHAGASPQGVPDHAGCYGQADVEDVVGRGESESQRRERQRPDRCLAGALHDEQCCPWCDDADVSSGVGECDQGLSAADDHDVDPWVDRERRAEHDCGGQRSG